MEIAVWDYPSFCCGFLYSLCRKELEGAKGQPEKTAGGNGTDIIGRAENAGTEVSDGSGSVRTAECL